MDNEKKQLEQLINLHVNALLEGRLDLKYLIESSLDISLKEQILEKLGDIYLDKLKKQIEIREPRELVLEHELLRLTESRYMSGYKLRKSPRFKPKLKDLANTLLSERPGWDSEDITRIYREIDESLPEAIRNKIKYEADDCLREGLIVDGCKLYREIGKSPPEELIRESTRLNLKKGNLWDVIEAYELIKKPIKVKDLEKSILAGELKITDVKRSSLGRSLKEKIFEKIEDRYEKTGDGYKNRNELSRALNAYLEGYEIRRSQKFKPKLKEVADALLETGNLTGLEVYRRFHIRFPHEKLFQVGNVNLRRGSLSAALDAYKGARKLPEAQVFVEYLKLPENAEYFHYVVDAYVHIKQLDEAVKLCSLLEKPQTKDEILRGYSSRKLRREATGK